MCGRYTLTSHEQIAEDLQASLDPQLAADPWWKPRYNVAPTQPAPVVILRRDRDDDPQPARPPRTIELMRWGLVPHWVEPGGKKPPLMINARLESLMAKQMFRDALTRKRCLVPMDGFFEWVRGGAARGGKQTPLPYYFHPPGHPPGHPRGDAAHRLCAFAGLWARSRDASGAELHSFTIITTRANPLVGAIHDRMPIVLPPDDYAAWLDPSIDADTARGLLGHPEGDDWLAEPVSTWVNKADHDDPRCIAPGVADPAAPQGRLFD
jgi:putative SOS response-associated peptidase YedK